MDFSIIIACFNHGLYIKEALENLGPLEEIVYEIIIVNDGSTDELTKNILIELENTQFFIPLKILHQANSGPAAARNYGITHSNGKYILPLDADNTISIEYLIKSKKLLDSYADLSIIYAKPTFFGEIGTFREWVLEDFNITRLLKENYIDTCAVFRKDVWVTNGGYDSQIPYRGIEDWVFWLDAYVNGYKFFYINEELFRYRILPNSVGSNLNQGDKVKANMAYILKKYPELYAGAWLELVRQNTSIQNRFNSLKDVYNKDIKNPLKSLLKYFYRNITNKKLEV